MKCQDVAESLFNNEMEQAKVRFPSGRLLLEGILAIPQGAGPFAVVILCHPHPLYGGSMDNNVMHGLSETLTQASLASFRFNFRGVGGSQGEFGHGPGEQEDVQAAVSFVSTAGEVDAERIGLAGYSAGAAFALPVAVNDARVKALAAISPPLSMFDFDLLRDCPKPKLLISGNRDDFTPPHHFLEFCQSFSKPEECQMIEGADHFWWGHESLLAAKVTAFFVNVL
jgi:alpha/beta superfamily hydrolase